MVVNLANEWCARGIQVELVLMDRNGEFLSFLDPRVLLVNLGVTRFRSVFWPLVRYFKAQKPDVTYVHLWPLTSLSCLAWLFVGRIGKLILCEHSVLKYHKYHGNVRFHQLLVLLLSFTHRFADKVVVVSRGMVNEFHFEIRIPIDKISLIHNPIVNVSHSSIRNKEFAERPKDVWKGLSGTRVLSVGVLSKVKNQLLIIEAFSKFSEKFDASLVICGEGPELEILRNRVGELGLFNIIRFEGFVSDLEPWFRGADVFVHSSNFESFGNVIVEALAHGVPVVSTDCPYGPREILCDGIFGELVPVGDCDELVLGLERCLGKKWDSRQLKARSLDFTVSRKADEYLNCLD